MKMSPDSPLCFQKAGHLPCCCRRAGSRPGALRPPEESRLVTLFLSPEPGLPWAACSQEQNRPQSCPIGCRALLTSTSRLRRTEPPPEPDLG